MAHSYRHPTVVDTGAAESHSSSHPVTTAISAASQVDENHQKQAFHLCLVAEAPQVVAAVAVKWSVEGNRRTVSSAPVCAYFVLRLFCRNGFLLSDFSSFLNFRLLCSNTIIPLSIQEEWSKSSAPDISACERIFSSKEERSSQKPVRIRSINWITRFPECV